MSNALLDDPSVRAMVEPEVQAAIDEVAPILDEMNTAFRKEDRQVVLQLYDVLTYTPRVQELAQRVMEVRPECQILEADEIAVNVLEPNFVAKRVQQLSPRRTPQQQQQQQEELRQRASHSTTRDSSRTVSPGSLNPNVNAAIGSDFNPFGGGPALTTEIAAAGSVSATAKALYDVERRLEHGCALGLLTAQEQAPEEEDHHLEMLEEFEVKFSRPSELLRAIRCQSATAQEACEAYRSKEGNITPDVLLGALMKHQPRSTDEIASFVAFARANEVPITMAVAETLERCYVKCMKGEGAEFVFHRMTKDVGLVPLTTRPFAMLFNSKKFNMARNVLDYYELMLDYGIAPEPSLLRILCKQCGGMEYASLHFTLRLKSHDAQQQEAKALAATANNANPNHNSSSSNNNSTGVVGGNQANGTAAGTSSPIPAAPDSRRKNERAYFEKRLEDMAEQNPDTPLMEALKVVHRAEVEGTSLEGDTLILTALLKLFCNGSTPVEDLVKPFSASIAYRPGKIENRAAWEAAAAAEEERRRGGGGRSMGRFTEDNAFDFGLEEANLETLDDVAAEAPGARSAGAGGGGSGGEERAWQTPGMSEMGGMGGGAAALLMGLEEEGLLDDDDDLEELAHKKFVEQGGGTVLKGDNTSEAIPTHRHHDPSLPPDDEDADSLDGELEDGVAEAAGETAGKSTTPTAGAAAAPVGKVAAGVRKDAAAAATASTSERSRRTPRHIPGIASPSEEAAYVLDVLATYGSLPDNNVLHLLATQYVNRGNSGIGVVQQVTQALFRAGHESRGTVEAVRSSSCHCLVRYYIRRHQRNKLTQLVRSFVEQCYEYNHVFRSSWAGDLDPRSVNYYLRNNTTFSAFATAAMKAGPLDWALGLLSLAMCMSSHPITDNTRARLCQVRDGESYSSPHRHVIDIFDDCDWDRDRILANDYFTSNGRNAGGEDSGGNSRSDRDSSQKGGGKGGRNASGGAVQDDIYAASEKEAQQISSSDNPRGLDGHRSLETYMRDSLREMNLGKDVVDYFKGRLRAEQLESVERLRSSGAKDHSTQPPQQQQQQHRGGRNRR